MNEVTDEFPVVDHLGPEQQITRAMVAHFHGPELADWAVSEDRVTAALIGAHLEPVLTALARSVADVVAAWEAP